MIDFSYESLNKLFPILHGDSKYSAGMLLPAAQRFTYTEEQSNVLGGEKGVHAQNTRIDAQNGFEWLLNTFNTLKNETISDHGSYSTPKNFEDYLRLLSTSSIGQIKNTIEDAELEIEAANEVAKMLNESVFADDVKRGIELNGVAWIRKGRWSNNSSELIRGEEAYNNLVALTKEKFQLLKVVADFFSEVKEVYKKELALREAQLPDTVKTLTQNLKNLIKEGGKKKRCLEKAAAKYAAKKTPENKAAFQQLWNEFAAIEAQYHGVRSELFKASPETKVPEPPTLSHEAWAVKGAFL
jgi:hypothetical protein